MTVKEILNKFGLTEKTQPSIKLIDFTKLENFVSIIVNSLIAKYSKEKVKREIQHDNPDSDVIGIVTHIIEVGGVKIILDSHLETSDEQKLQNSAFVVSVALDFALSNELKKHGVNKSDRYNYYDYDALEIIIERVMIHVLAGNPESRRNFEFYANDMVKVNLFNKL